MQRRRFCSYLPCLPFIPVLQHIRGGSSEPGQPRPHVHAHVWPEVPFQHAAPEGERHVSGNCHRVSRFCREGGFAWLTTSQNSSLRTPKLRKTVNVPTPRTPTPFKNALAAQEKMHGPLKMEVSGKVFAQRCPATVAVVLKACPPALAAAAPGLPGGGHTGSAEAGDGSGHLQQGRRPARLQNLETRACPSRAAAHVESSRDWIVNRWQFFHPPLKADGPARKVRKSLVLDLWGKDCLPDQQLFEEQLNNAQVSRNKDASEEPEPSDVRRRFGCFSVSCLAVDPEAEIKKGRFCARQVPDESLLTHSALSHAAPEQEECGRPLTSDPGESSVLPAHPQRPAHSRMRKLFASHKASKHTAAVQVPCIRIVPIPSEISKSQTHTHTHPKK